MSQFITLHDFKKMCLEIMNWDQCFVEKRFHGLCEEIVSSLNECDELEMELFFTGFFCDNPIVDVAADGQVDIGGLGTVEKVQIFINRGRVLCSLIGHEPGFVVRVRGTID